MLHLTSSYLIIYKEDFRASANYEFLCLAISCRIWYYWFNSAIIKLIYYTSKKRDSS